MRHRNVLALLHGQFPRSLALAVALLCGSGGAVSWHVDATRPDDSGDGRTPATAWSSLAPLRSLELRPGDSILLARGSTWTDSILRWESGTAQAPLVLAAYGDPALPRPRLRTPSRAGILLWRARHWIVRDLAVEGATQACVEVSDTLSGQVRLTGMELSDCGFGVSVAGTGILVDSNHVHDLRMVVATAGEAGTREADDDYGAVGVVLDGARDCRVTGNVFERCRAPSPDYGVDGGAVEVWGSVRRCEIDHNRGLDTDGWIEMGGRSGDTAADISVHHNIALESGHFAVFHTGTGSYFHLALRNIRLEHNTAVTRTRRAWTLLAFPGGASASPPAVLLRGNVFVVDTLDRAFDHRQFESADNVWWTPARPVWESPLDGPGDTLADPRLDLSWRPAPDGPAAARVPDLGWSTDLHRTTYPSGPRPAGALGLAASSSATARRIAIPHAGGLRGRDAAGRKAAPGLHPLAGGSGTDASKPAR